MAEVETVEISDGQGGTMIVNKSDDEQGLFDHVKGKAKPKAKAKAKAKAK